MLGAARKANEYEGSYIKEKRDSSTKPSHKKFTKNNEQTVKQPFNDNNRDQ